MKIFGFTLEWVLVFGYGRAYGKGGISQWSSLAAARNYAKVVAYCGPSLIYPLLTRY